MNCLQAVNVAAENFMPWFEERELDVVKAKVYHDSGHYVAHPVSTLPSQRRSSAPSELKKAFDGFYSSLLVNSPSRADIIAQLSDKLKEYFTSDSETSDSSEDDVRLYVIEQLKNKEHNAYLRRKRFRRKAHLNKWTHFVTFTYSDELHDEESFRKKLHKCLYNFSTRRGWRYMGVFERAPETGRLHFHALMYIPEGQMPGELRASREYSTKHKKMITSHINSFFEEKFGRNDFEPIDDDKFSINRSINYILKYMEKTGETVTYSRGIPTEMLVELPREALIAGFVDYIVKYVVPDDYIDWESDILNKGSKPYISSFDSDKLRL